MIALNVEVENSELERAIAAYAVVKNIELEDAYWRKLAFVAGRASKLARQELPVAQLPDFPSGKGSSGDWRLVQWLANKQSYVGSLTKLAREERAQRRKSRNFGRAMIAAVGKAAKARGSVKQGRRIRGSAEASRRGEFISVEASSAIRYLRSITRALRPRDDSRLSRRLKTIIDRACKLEADDTARYTSRALDKAARKAGFRSANQQHAAALISRARRISG